MLVLALLALAGALLSTASHAAQSIAAAGTSQSNAAMLPADIVFVTSVPTGSGVILTANTGQPQQVFNRDAANTLKVYPPSGARIETLGANAPYPELPGDQVPLECASATQCYVVRPPGHPLVTTVSALPASAPPGTTLYVSDCRAVAAGLTTQAQAAGAGTGCLATYNTNGSVWQVAGTNVAVSK